MDFRTFCYIGATDGKEQQRNAVHTRTPIDNITQKTCAERDRHTFSTNSSTHRNKGIKSHLRSTHPPNHRNNSQRRQPPHHLPRHPVHLPPPFLVATPLQTAVIALAKAAGVVRSFHSIKRLDPEVHVRKERVGPPVPVWDDRDETTITKKQQISCIRSTHSTSDNATCGMTCQGMTHGQKSIHTDIYSHAFFSQIY